MLHAHLPQVSLLCRTVASCDLTVCCAICLLSFPSFLLAARGERLGLGAHSSTDTVAELGDVYSSYRKLRSTSYHQMIVEGVGVSNMAKGG